MGSLAISMVVKSKLLKVSAKYTRRKLSSLNYVLSMALSLNDEPMSRIGAELLSPAINEHPSGLIEVPERNIKNLSLQKSPNY